MRSISIYLLFLAMLVACTQVQQPNLITPRIDTEGSLFVDADIDAAVLELTNSDNQIIGTEGITISDGEEIELNNNGYESLSTQLVLPNTEGSISYIKYAHDSRPWEIWCIDQVKDSRTRIYKGTRKINSVAGNVNCNIITFSMFTPSRGNYEIYRLVDGSLSRLTQNNADDTDISQNAGSNIVVWTYNGNLKDTIYYRTYDGLSNFVQKRLVNSNSQVQPSIDGNGENIVFIRELPNGWDRIMLYNIVANNYTVVHTSSRNLEHPSFGNKKVAWLDNGVNLDRVKVKDLTVGTTKIVLINPEIEHPHLDNNGLLLAYGIKVNNSFDVFVKNLETEEKVQGVFAIAPREHYGMFWQLPLSIAQTFDVYKDANDPSLYHANSLNSLSTYSGKLKYVVESAVAELDLSVGGTISFRAGLFNLGKDYFHIRDVDNITFKGQGMDLTTIRNYSNVAADTEVFNFGRMNNIKIMNLRVFAGGSLRRSSDAIDGDAVSNSIFENFKIVKSRGRGVVLDGKEQAANNNVIRNCVISGVPENGIELLASSSNLVENCTITNVSEKGINITKASPSADNPNKQSNFNVVRNNTIRNAGDDGIKINGSSRNTITNNTIEESSDDGIQIGTTDGIFCHRNIFGGNTATDNARYGLNISNLECNETVVWSGNNFTNNGPNGSWTIQDKGTNTIFP